MCYEFGVMCDEADDCLHLFESGIVYESLSNPAAYCPLRAYGGCMCRWWRVGQERNRLGVMPLFRPHCHTITAVLQPWLKLRAPWLHVNDVGFTPPTILWVPAPYDCAHQWVVRDLLSACTSLRCIPLDRGHQPRVHQARPPHRRRMLYAEL